MKERNLFRDEFEDLLRSRTDQYKMYPSDRVWNNIDNKLHGRKKKYIVGMSALIGGILIFAGTELLSPAAPPVASARTIASGSGSSMTSGAAAITPFLSETGTEAGATAPVHNAAPLAWEAARNAERIPFFAVGPTNARVTQEAIAAASVDPGWAESAHTPIAPAVAALAGRVPVVASDDFRMGLLNASVAPAAEGSANAIKSFPTASAATAAAASAAAGKTSRTTGDADVDVLPLADQRNLAVVHYDEVRPDGLQPDEDLSFQAPAGQRANHLLRGSRFGWQLYVTPMLTDRELIVTDYNGVHQTISNTPVALIQFGNVNDFDHTPAMGYQIGGSLMYRLNGRLTLKAGLEFSYSRYSLRAYNNGSDLAATRLGSYLGYLPDSLTGANAGLSDGKSNQTLQNKYYQLNIPIGLEYRLAGKGRLQWHVGAVVEPSYLLNRSAYVLGTDLSSYGKNESAFRRFNLNGELETFVSYQIGGLRWQIGPQFRYQLLSSYRGNYPVAENLLNYGIKIGFTKALW